MVQFMSLDPYWGRLGSTFKPLKALLRPTGSSEAHRSHRRAQFLTKNSFPRLCNALKGIKNEVTFFGQNSHSKAHQGHARALTALVGLRKPSGLDRRVRSGVWAKSMGLIMHWFFYPDKQKVLYRWGLFYLCCYIHDSVTTVTCWVFAMTE